MKDTATDPELRITSPGQFAPLPCVGDTLPALFLVVMFLALTRMTWQVTYTSPPGRRGLPAVGAEALPEASTSSSMPLTCGSCGRSSYAAGL
jgi:hypothetical protein